jgi:hypothetical protein
MSEPQPSGEKGFDVGAMFHVFVEIGWTLIHWGSLLFLLEQYGFLRPVISPLLESMWHEVRN